MIYILIYILHIKCCLGAKHTSYMSSIVQLYFINIDEILTANCKKKIFFIYMQQFFYQFSGNILTILMKYS